MAIYVSCGGFGASDNPIDGNGIYLYNSISGIYIQLNGSGIIRYSPTGVTYGAGYQSNSGWILSVGNNNRYIMEKPSGQRPFTEYNGAIFDPNAHQYGYGTWYSWKDIDPYAQSFRPPVSFESFIYDQQYEQRYGGLISIGTPWPGIVCDIPYYVETACEYVYNKIIITGENINPVNYGGSGTISGIYQLVPGHDPMGYIYYNLNNPRWWIYNSFDTWRLVYYTGINYDPHPLNNTVEDSLEFYTRPNSNLTDEPPCTMGGCITPPVDYYDSPSWSISNSIGGNDLLVANLDIEYLCGTKASMPWAIRCGWSPSTPSLGWNTSIIGWPEPSTASGFYILRSSNSNNIFKSGNAFYLRRV